MIFATKISLKRGWNESWMLKFYHKGEYICEFLVYVFSVCLLFRLAAVWLFILIPLKSVNHPGLDGPHHYKYYHNNLTQVTRWARGQRQAEQPMHSVLNKFTQNTRSIEPKDWRSKIRSNDSWFKFQTLQKIHWIKLLWTAPWNVSSKISSKLWDSKNYNPPQRSLNSSIYMEYTVFFPFICSLC